MTNGTVILLGSSGTQPLNGLVQEFSWALETSASLDEFRDLNAVRSPAAILFDADSLGLSWRQALRSIREIDSHALLIVCHKFSNHVDWSELAEAGAFHALALPWDVREVRQSLAFVWSARFRRASKVVPIGGQGCPVSRQDVVAEAALAS